MCNASLTQSAQTIAEHLDAVRQAAMAFQDTLKQVQPRLKLARFDATSFFTDAVKESYASIRQAFLQDRTRSGTAPRICDDRIASDFRKALETDEDKDLVDLDVAVAVQGAMTALDRLLPQERAETEVFRQLAERVWDTMGLSNRQFQSKGGRVLLSYSTCIDSIDKKYSKVNNYSYHTNDRIRNQMCVLGEIADVYNATANEPVSSRLLGWNELRDLGQQLSRTPNCAPLFGGELKCRVSAYEWHLHPDFAAFISEFISLYR